MKIEHIPVLFLPAVFAIASPQGTEGQPKSSLPPNFGKEAVPFGPKPAGCSEFEILVGEPGPFGVIAGDPLVKNVVAAIPTARGYAVQYPAALSEDSIRTGVKDVVSRLTGQDAACPTQKFALVGYSQGARVMRAASVKLENAFYPKIVAMVMFGDRGMRELNMTQFPPELQAKLFENCAPKDPGCSGDGTDAKPHLTYNKAGTPYQEDSAKFIIAAFKGTPMPAKPVVTEVMKPI